MYSEYIFFPAAPNIAIISSHHRLGLFSDVIGSSIKPDANAVSSSAISTNEDFETLVDLTLYTD